MMKGFLKIGKLMGLMLLASGLLFAGCAQPGGGSSEDAVTGGTGFLIPITMDTAKGVITVGDGTGMATGTWEGHQVGLKNTGACTGTTNASCTIRVTNLDPNYYMTNTYIYLSFCAQCTGDKYFSNADLAAGATVFVEGSLTGQGGMADINKSAFCVAEDGKYVAYGEPFNSTGCPTVKTKDNYHPVQFIHAHGGIVDVPWNFSTATGDNFKFYANIVADWYPENIMADSRYDFDKFTSYYITINALNDKIPTATYRQWWRVGSWKRSTTLVGYGSNGGANNGDLSLAINKYFAVNVMAEASDRIESYTGTGCSDVDAAISLGGGGGMGNCFSDYEYYTQFSWILRYDPTVIKAASSGLLSKTSTTSLTYNSNGLDWSNCLAGNCVVGTPAYTGFTTIAGNFGDAISQPNGWLFGYIGMNDIVFNWFIPVTDVYKTTAGASVVTRAPDILPKQGGFNGLVKVNLNPIYTSGIWYIDTGLIQNGTPDNDPEQGLALYYFKVQATASGKATGIYGDHWVTDGAAMIGWTNGTAAGGNGAGTDDFIFGCLPVTPGFEAQQGCDPGKTRADYNVFGGAEVANTAIHTSASGVKPDGGAFQYWNVHLTVL